MEGGGIERAARRRPARPGAAVRTATSLAAPNSAGYPRVLPRRQPEPTRAPVPL